jgi:hypothetical protein
VGPSGNNKYIELYNPTQAAFNLSGWALAVHVTSADAKPAAGNTGEGSYLYEFGSGVTIPAGGTYVLAHAEAHYDVLSAANARGVTIAYANTTAGGRIVSFTQNQRVALYNGNTVVDRVPAASTGMLGQDKTYVRKPGFGANAVYTEAEWNIISPGVVTNVGWHTFVIGGSSSSISSSISSSSSLSSSSSSSISSSISSSSSSSSSSISSSSSQGVINPPQSSTGGNVYVGAITFNSTVNTLPLSANLQTATSFINAANNNVDQTALCYAVSKAIPMFNQTGLPAFDKTFIVTFTDGADNGSSWLWQQEAPPVYVTTSQVYTKAQALLGEVPGLTTYAIGFEVPGGEQLVQTDMEKLVQGGQYRATSDPSQLNTIFKDIADSVLASSKNMRLITNPAYAPESDPKKIKLTVTAKPTLSSSTVYTEDVYGDMVYDLAVPGAVPVFTVTGTPTYVSFDNPITGQLVTINGVQKVSLPFNNLKFVYNGTECFVQSIQAQVSRNGGLTYVTDLEDSSASEDISKNIGVVLVMDCSLSLGTFFPTVQTAANNFIDILGGGTGGTPPAPPPPNNQLTAGVWANGSLVSGGVQYTMNVTSGTTYRIWWNDSYQGNGTKSVDVMVSARYTSSGTSIFSSVDSGWSSPQSFTANSTGTVTITVTGYSGATSGTFGVVYSTSSTRPST